MRQSTHQGWRDDSSWARGLAWALYGFGSAYLFSKDIRFLNTAEACAAYYIEHTPANGVPPNDWFEPDPPRPYESSAAAIAASLVGSATPTTSNGSGSSKWMRATREHSIGLKVQSGGGGWRHGIASS